MRERLQGHEISRLAWSTAAGAFVCLTGIALGTTKTTALVAGVAAGAAVFLVLRLYGVRLPYRP
jgi:hypothetical protein